MKPSRLLFATILSLSGFLVAVPLANAQVQAPAPFGGDAGGVAAASIRAGGDTSAAAGIDALKSTVGTGGSFLDKLGSSFGNIFGGKLGIALGGAPVNDAQTNLLRSENKFKFTLDGLAWTAVNAVLSGMTKSVVTWINNGFDGSPSFVTDPAGFFTDVADQVSGAYIQKLGLTNQLCSPFRAQILLSLTTYARNPTPRYQCTLSTVVKNFDNFVSSFTKGGGWPAWISLSREENNPYVRVMNEAQELDRQQAVAAELKKQELQWGNGFISTRNPYNTSQIDTPGSVIEAQLNNALDSSARRLEVANSVNEVFGALADQLVSKVITGARGLFGATRATATKPSYLDQVAASQAADQAIVRNGVVSSVATDQASENQFKAAKDQSIAIVTGTRDLLLSLKSCLLNPQSFAGTAQGTTISSASTVTGGTTPFGVGATSAVNIPGFGATQQAQQQTGGTPQLATTNPVALAAAATVTTTIDTQINPVLASLLQDSQASAGLATQLQLIKTTGSTAVTADQIATFAANYQSTRNQFHDDTAVAAAQAEIPQVTAFVAPIAQDAQTRLVECRQGIIRP